MKEKLTFKQSIERLDEIIEQLNQNEGELEDAITQFEEGLHLVKDCDGQLQHFEQRMNEVLNEVLNSGRTEMEIKVIKKILYSPRIKQKELAEDVGAYVSTVQRIIKKLVKEEKIVRMNGKRNGYWKVLQNVC